MIQGLATSLFSPMTSHLLAAATLQLGEVATTLYLSDTQFQHLGPVPFTRNPLIKKFSPVADRNVIATQTAAIFVDTLLRHAEARAGEGPLTLEVLGDIPDTPAEAELVRFEKILDHHTIPIEGYARGNHSSHNAFGVVNLKSRLYEFLRCHVPLFRGFSLRQEMEKACGSQTRMLSAQDTLAGMHRILHRHRSEMPGVERINVAVTEVNARGCRLADPNLWLLFEEDPHPLFTAFWHPSAATERGESGETPYWEAMVNYQVANRDVADRPTPVTPFYIQAAETARFALGGGCEAPVYTVSLDSMDNTNLFATRPGISELQVQLAECFIGAKLRENPLARFKLSCHFGAEALLNRSVPRRVRQLFCRLLAREQIILYTSGHDHERNVIDLNKTLRLKRATPLPAIVVPSLIDYHPHQTGQPGDDYNARAILTERMWAEADAKGEAQLQLDLCYQGLDPEAIARSATPDVRRELEQYERDHGYVRAKGTSRDWRNKHIYGWLWGQVKRAWEIVSIGCNVFRPRRMVRYWRDFSIVQYVIDNFTVASTVNMFNEAEHLIPFLDSLLYLIAQDRDPEQRAVQAQIDGIRTALVEDYAAKRTPFERALAQGRRAVEVRTFNNLFAESGIHLLAELLLKLGPDSQARTFAVLAGLAASRAEFEFHHRSPTEVPNHLPSHAVPLGVQLAVGIP